MTVTYDMCTVCVYFKRNHAQIWKGFTVCCMTSLLISLA